jgi:hypothetical protein
MDNGIKVTKSQALDLLTEQGRTHWQIRLDVTSSKGYTLPRCYDTLCFPQIEEIIDKSNSRTYGRDVYLRNDGTRYEVMTLGIKVGNATFSLHPCGHLF